MTLILIFVFSVLLWLCIMPLICPGTEKHHGLDRQTSSRTDGIKAIRVPNNVKIF